MPLYVLRCEGEKHQEPAPFEWETYLPTYNTPNPACEMCGGPSERVWRGRQTHAGLSGFPMVTKMLSGVPERFETRRDWEKAVEAKGLRIRDDASWLDEELGQPTFNWKTRRTEYPERRTVLGGKGTWF